MGNDDLQYRVTAVTGIFSMNRRPGALWALVQEPDTPHAVGRSDEMSRMFFDDVLPTRIGAMSGSTLSRSIRPRAGKAISPNIPSPPVVPGAKMPDEPTVWLPTERMAKAWVAVENGTPFEKIGRKMIGNMLDLVLAVAHHVLIFGLFGVLFAEFILVRPGLDAGHGRSRGGHRSVVRHPAGPDHRDRIFAGGLRRQGLGLLFPQSVLLGEDRHLRDHRRALGRPTIRFLRWRREGVAPDEGQIARVRRFLWAQLALFPLLLIFAAAMARGFGEIL